MFSQLVVVFGVSGVLQDEWHDSFHVIAKAMPSLTTNRTDRLKKNSERFNVDKNKIFQN
jgi:hypothetical protein